MRKFRTLKTPIRFDPSVSDYQRYVFEIAILAAVVIVVVVNLPYQYVVAAIEGGYRPGPTDLAIDLQRMTQPHQAGWPITYSRTHTFAQSSSVWDFSFVALLFDMLLGGVLVVLVGLYFWPARKRFRSKEKIKQNAKRLIYTAVAVGLGVVYWWVLAAQTSSDREAAESLRRRGHGVVRMSILPGAIAPIAPPFVTDLRMRIALIALKDPDEAETRSALDHRWLRGLRIDGGTLDTATLDGLERMPMLQDFALKNHADAGSLPRRLGKSELLSSLNMTGTPLDEKQIADIARNPRLESLSLLDCGITLPSLEESRLSRRVSQLIVSRPVSGGMVIQLKNWTRLARLALLSSDATPNTELLQLSLTQMPQLERVFVDPLQVIDFSGSDLPVFQGISPHRELNFAGVQATTPLDESSDTADGGLLIETFKLQDAASCRHLTLNAGRIKTIDFEDCPEMESLTILGTAIEGLSTVLDQASPGADTGGPMVADIPAANRQAVIDSIGDLRGPVKVSLNHLLLSDLRLLPLTYNQRIRSLDLSHCTISPEAMNTLEAMALLQRLDLRGIELTTNTYGWIDRSFPNLQELIVSRNEANRIVFSDHTSLMHLRMDQYEPSPIEGIVLKNLTQWRSPVVTAEPTLKVDIQNVPLLEGLGVPGPCELAIGGVRGLRWFASGGTNCNDDVLGEILLADGLQRLSIVYPTATTDKLQPIRNLKRLIHANLAGCPLDDAFVLGWKVPETMRTIILDDCVLSDKSMLALVSHESWAGLSIARTGISATSMRMVNKMKGLKVLGLAGQKLDSVTLNAITQLPALEDLDLHDAELPAGAVASLTKLVSLKRINLAGCELNDDDLRQLKAAKPQLEFVETIDSWDFLHDLARHDAAGDQATDGFEMPLLRRDLFRRSTDTDTAPATDAARQTARAGISIR